MLRRTSKLAQVATFGLSTTPVAPRQSLEALLFPKGPAFIRREAFCHLLHFPEKRRPSCRLHPQKPVVRRDVFELGCSFTFGWRSGHEFYETSVSLISTTKTAVRSVFTSTIHTTGPVQRAGHVGIGAPCACTERYPGSTDKGQSTARVSPSGLLRLRRTATVSFIAKFTHR